MHLHSGLSRPHLHLIEGSLIHARMVKALPHCAPMSASGCHCTCSLAWAGVIAPRLTDLRSYGQPRRMHLHSGLGLSRPHLYIIEGSLIAAGMVKARPHLFSDDQ